mmetsp:Transcript_59690/g.146395  ORF Transcript_59690/g.146395 Transcript_59690/m.146395 type:complete len:201 (-) Transcript_59690:339-941(-)
MGVNVTEVTFGAAVTSNNAMSPVDEDESPSSVESFVPRGTTLILSPLRRRKCFATFSLTVAVTASDFFVFEPFFATATRPYVALRRRPTNPTTCPAFTPNSFALLEVNVTVESRTADVCWYAARRTSNNPGRYSSSTSTGSVILASFSNAVSVAAWSGAPPPRTDVTENGSLLFSLTGNSDDRPHGRLLTTLLLGPFLLA